MKLSIFKYSFVTKIQFVHQYQNTYFCNIDQISILLQKFNLVTHIKTCIFEILINFYFFTKVHFVHWYWSFQSSKIHLLQKLNLFTQIKTCVFKYWSNSILSQKFILFTHIEDFNLQVFICYKISICSPISKPSFL